MCAKKFLTKGMDFPGYESSETEPPTPGVPGSCVTYNNSTSSYHMYNNSTAQKSVIPKSVRAEPRRCPHQCWAVSYKPTPIGAFGELTHRIQCILHSRV